MLPSNQLPHSLITLQLSCETQGTVGKPMNYECIRHLPINIRKETGSFKKHKPQEDFVKGKTKITYFTGQSERLQQRQPA